MRSLDTLSKRGKYSMPITRVQRQKLTYLKLTYFFKLVNFKFPEFCVFAKNFLALSGRKMKGKRTKVGT